MNLPKGTYLQGGKYVIEGVLGQGGFGFTYKAVQVGLNRTVAIKEFFIGQMCGRNADLSVTLPSPQHGEIWSNYKAKFLKEARTIASLSHPNIVKVIDVFEENGTSYYAMEYLEGQSLKDLIEERGALPEQQALEIIDVLADALQEIHSQKILHLDFKPANIMMRNNKTPIIIDFGISKHYDSAGKQTSVLLLGSSRGYSPIEQYTGDGLDKFSPATDIYSLGATLYFMLNRQDPPEPHILLEHGLTFIQLVSLPVKQAIEKAMALKKNDRPQSVAEFLLLLNQPSPAKTPVVNTEISPDTPSKDEIPQSTTLLQRQTKGSDRNENITMQISIILGIVFILLFGIIIYRSTRPQTTSRQTYYEDLYTPVTKPTRVTKPTIYNVSKNIDLPESKEIKHNDPREPKQKTQPKQADTPTIKSEPMVKLQSPSTVTVGENFQLKYVVSSKSASEFSAPKIEGCELIYGPSTTVSTSTINGKQTTQTNYSYTYKARTSGKFTIPSVTIKVEGKRYSTSPTTLNIMSRFDLDDGFEAPNEHLDRSIEYKNK